MHGLNELHMSLLIMGRPQYNGKPTNLVQAEVDRAWSGMAFALSLVVIHLTLVRGWQRQLTLVVASGTAGFLFDSLQLWFGVFRFPDRGMLCDWLAPPWDAVLWMQFATILPFCLRWLSGRYWLCCVLGFVGGPMAFYTGEKFGAIAFLDPRLLHFAVLGLVWAVAFPLLVWTSDRLILSQDLGERYRFGRSRSSSGT